MSKSKPFIDKNYPDIGEDKIVLDFNDRSSRQSLKIFAKLTEDDDLRERIEIRCRHFDRVDPVPISTYEKSTPEQIKKREEWRRINRIRALRHKLKEAKKALEKKK